MHKNDKEVKLFTDGDVLHFKGRLIPTAWPHVGFHPHCEHTYVYTYLYGKRGTELHQGESCVFASALNFF